MVELSVVFPAYNEEFRICNTLKAFNNYLKGKGIAFELLVVDDGSVDNTAGVVEAFRVECPNLRYIALPQNRGKGCAIRTGMLEAKGKIRLFSDADGSTPPEDIDKLIEPLFSNNADISIGSRYHPESKIVQKQPKYRRIWSRFVNRIVQRILLPGIADPHCGFKAFTTEAAEKVFSVCEIDGWSFDLEALAIAREQNLRIAEIPVQWANDDRSKGRLSQMPGEVYNLYQIKRKQGKASTTK